MRDGFGRVGDSRITDKDQALRMAGERAVSDIWSKGHRKSTSYPQDEQEGVEEVKRGGI